MNAATKQNILDFQKDVHDTLDLGNVLIAAWAILQDGADSLTMATILGHAISFFLHTFRAQREHLSDLVVRGTLQKTTSKKRKLDVVDESIFQDPLSKKTKKLMLAQEKLNNARVKQRQQRFERPLRSGRRDRGKGGSPWQPRGGSLYCGRRHGFRGHEREGGRGRGCTWGERKPCG